MGSRPPNSDHDLFFFLIFGASLAFGSALELLLGPTTELVISGCHVKSLFIACHNSIKKWLVVVWNKRRLTSK